jgi:hypothetical protein
MKIVEDYSMMGLNSPLEKQNQRELRQSMKLTNLKNLFEIV